MPRNWTALRPEVLAREGPRALNSYFHFKPVWQRAIVVAAGPLANFVLSIVLTAGLLAAIGERTLPARIDTITPSEPAAIAGFQPGDLIERADGQIIDSFDSLQQYVQIRAGTPIRFQVERAGHELTLTATPISREIDNGLGGRQTVGALGISAVHQASDIRYQRFGPLQALSGGVSRTWDKLTTSVFIINRLIHGELPAGQLSGPLGIAQLSGAVVHAGAAGEPTLGLKLLGALTNLLNLAAILSVSVGFMNLLPVPVLDGGHLLFYAFEAATRRPLGAKLQAAGVAAGRSAARRADSAQAPATAPPGASAASSSASSSRAPSGSRTSTILVLPADPGRAIGWIPRDRRRHQDPVQDRSVRRRRDPAAGRRT
jgi:regulator of sigma E protease